MNENIITPEPANGREEGESAPNIEMSWDRATAIMTYNGLTLKIHFGEQKERWVAGFLNLYNALLNGKIRIEEAGYKNPNDPTGRFRPTFEQVSDAIMGPLERERRKLAGKQTIH